MADNDGDHDPAVTRAQADRGEAHTLILALTLRHSMRAGSKRQGLWSW